MGIKTCIRFMWTLYSKDPEHWISIETVGSFKRMRPYSSEGVPWLAKALELSTFLEVDETRTKVRRTTEPQEPKNQFERSVYAVCWPFTFNQQSKTNIVSPVPLERFR
jgi:lupus La protein